MRDRGPDASLSVDLWKAMLGCETGDATPEGIIAESIERYGAGITSPAYELSLRPAGLGSLPPTIRFTEDGAASTGREGIFAEGKTVRANEGLPLSIWVQDRGEQVPDSRIRNRPPITVYWVKHQGPGSAEFDRQRQTVNQEGWGEAATMVTFREPGEYILRARVDNFGAPDSGLDYQCCWSNAYLRVTVTP